MCWLDGTKRQAPCVRSTTSGTLSLHCYDYGRSENSMCRATNNIYIPKSARAALATRECQSTWSTKTNLEFLMCRKRSGTKQWVVELIPSPSIGSLFGRHSTNSSLEARSINSNRENISFAFAFGNRKCNFHLVSMTQRRTCSSTSLLHVYGIVSCESRSHVNVAAKLKLTMHWWDNTVEISMPEETCACSRTEGWTRPNAEDKLYIAFAANQASNCSPLALCTFLLEFVIFPFIAHTRTPRSNAPDKFGDELKKNSLLRDPSPRSTCIANKRSNDQGQKVENITAIRRWQFSFVWKGENVNISGDYATLPLRLTGHKTNYGASTLWTLTIYFCWWSAVANLWMMRTSAPNRKFSFSLL